MKQLKEAYLMVMNNSVHQDLNSVIRKSVSVFTAKRKLKMGNEIQSIAIRNQMRQCLL